MGFAAIAPHLAHRASPSSWTVVRHAPAVALDPSVAFYELQLSAENLLSQQLATELTPLSAATLFSAGLLTSLTPCGLAAVPLTLGYLGGLRTDQPQTAPLYDQASTSTSVSSGDLSGGGGVGVGGGGGMTESTGRVASLQLRTLLPAVSYAFGFALVLAGLGVAASALGSVFGSAGVPGLPLLVALLTSAMGLNLLELLPINLPSLSLSTQLPGGLPPVGQALVFGAVSALVTSPCASPVLVGLLGVVAQLRDPVLGAVLLLIFTLGYTAPVLAAGVLATSVRQLADLTERFLWVTPASGCLLLAYGTYSGCCFVFGQP